jgi:hypothetical protein
MTDNSVYSDRQLGFALVSTITPIFVLALSKLVLSYPASLRA